MPKNESGPAPTERSLSSRPLPCPISRAATLALGVTKHPPTLSLICLMIGSQLRHPMLLGTAPFQIGWIGVPCIPRHGWHCHLGRRHGLLVTRPHPQLETIDVGVPQAAWNIAGNQIGFGNWTTPPSDNAAKPGIPGGGRAWPGRSDAGHP